MRTFPLVVFAMQGFYGPCIYIGDYSGKHYKITHCMDITILQSVVGILYINRVGPEIAL